MKFTDIILQTTTKVLVFIILTYSVYILFAGHHNPGGGFIGGLITASSLVLLYMAFDVQTVRKIVPFDFKRVGAIGVIIALLTGTSALLFGAPFLFQTFSYVDLPVFGTRELATAVLFDLGVYFAVIGTAITIILSISEDR
ncbi:Na(+)/H(+) antiporter subunit B [Xylanibacillus composti]|uniref:Na(+)/H(+) antiporter subunit B n=1 Tax=Xylanibacillus composti TaxID=1572762 RepID=A0A8J4H3X2_9BACL|nr:Na(+)/H(+) antiporter subunit B [Xylanibacillus composti]MDT9725340.1 Na(+)/H(+) antiporter subunit B [Xylanibacillus composti]GIQ69101.1 Na(+)/H(+) antiporter subunit B [Xylanibacillus composti]